MWPIMRQLETLLKVIAVVAVLIVAMGILFYLVYLLVASVVEPFLTQTGGSCQVTNRDLVRCEHLYLVSVHDEYLHSCP